MISIRSIYNFITINTFLFLLAYIEYIIIHDINLFNKFVLFVLRNYTLIYMIEYNTTSKPKINEETSTELYNHEFNIHVLSSTFVETMTYIIIQHNFDFSDDNGVYSIVTFIPISFLFEICFDFFHYFSHRILHNKYLYKYLHKKHHTFKHPSAIITFYQDPMDLVLTNSVPTILTLSIYKHIFYPKMSYYQFHLITIYKTFIEISGHCGRVMYPTSSFTQCIWLPRIFGIELYTEDHDLHHSMNNCNYAKRFSLWDKIFGTYK